MNKPGMTSEDIAWIEAQLGEAAARVAPRSEYIARTKAAVLEGRIDDPEANTLAAAFVVAAMVAAGAGFTAALLQYLTRRRRR
jgi:hypothetical protein